MTSWQEWRRTAAPVAATRNWLRVLISVLGVFEILMAAGAGPVTTIAIGVVGGVALVAAPWITGVRVPTSLLLIGSVPFAIITWWTAVSPLLAVLALAMGLVLLHAARHPKLSTSPAAR